MKVWFKLGLGAAVSCFAFFLTVSLDVYAFKNLETKLLALLLVLTLLTGCFVWSSIKKIIQKIKGTYVEEEDYYDPDEHFW